MFTYADDTESHAVDTYEPIVPVDELVCEFTGVSEHMSLVLISISCSRIQSSRTESRGASGEGYLRLVSYFSHCVRQHLTQAIG